VFIVSYKQYREIEDGLIRHEVWDYIKRCRDIHEDPANVGTINPDPPKRLSASASDAAVLARAYDHCPKAAQVVAERPFLSDGIGAFTYNLSAEEEEHAFGILQAAIDEERLPTHGEMDEFFALMNGPDFVPPTDEEARAWDKAKAAAHAPPVPAPARAPARTPARAPARAPASASAAPEMPELKRAGGYISDSEEEGRGKDDGRPSGSSMAGQLLPARRTRNTDACYVESPDGSSSSSSSSSNNNSSSASSAEHGTSSGDKESDSSGFGDSSDSDSDSESDDSSGAQKQGTSKRANRRSSSAAGARRGTSNRVTWNEELVSSPTYYTF
jgi:hypothetical protein